MASNRADRFDLAVIGAGSGGLVAAIVGPHAGELIHEDVLAIRRGMTIGRLAGPTHIYPTQSEINPRVAIDDLADSFFNDRTRRILRLLFRYRDAAG